MTATCQSIRNINIELHVLSTVTSQVTTPDFSFQKSKHHVTIHAMHMHVSK